MWSEKVNWIGQIHVNVYNGNDLNPIWTPVDGGNTLGLNWDTQYHAQTPGKLTRNGLNLRHKYCAYLRPNGVVHPTR